jgi:hypothetical protein
MSEILYIESRCLINSTLGHHMRVRIRVVDTFAHGHIVEDAQR